MYTLTCDTLGFYARSVADLEKLADVFRLADDEPIPSTAFTLKGAKIGFCKTHVWPNAGPGLKNAWAKAQEILTKHEAVIEDVELPEEFSQITDWHSSVLAGEGRSSFLGSKCHGCHRLRCLY